MLKTLFLVYSNLELRVLISPSIPIKIHHWNILVPRTLKLLLLLKNLVGCQPPGHRKKGGMMLSIPGIALRAQQEQDCSLLRSGRSSLNSLERKVESVKLLYPCQKVNSSEIMSPAVCQRICL